MTKRADIPDWRRRPVARMTICVCGHEGIAHYDSHLFCTYSMDGECDCEKFRPAGPEVIVDVTQMAQPLAETPDSPADPSAQEASQK